MDIKWIRKDMDLNKIVDNNTVINIQNSGILETDFFIYSKNFFEAANLIVKHLLLEASKNHDIAKLDLWYFALIYLYRQSLELLLKANIFQIEQNSINRKDIIGRVRHDLKQGFEEIVKLTNTDININANLIWLNAFLSDISTIDRESDMFRYPFGSNLRVLFDKQTHISLEATYYNFNRAFDILKILYNTHKFSAEEYKKELQYDPKLIIEGGDYYYQSVVGYKYAERAFYPYYTSYEECASFLKDIIISEGKTNLFMPMCYLYRNSVELGLKRLIVEDSHLGSEKALRTIKRKKHSIKGLWNSIVDELKTHVQDGDDTLDVALNYIDAFHNMDITSDKFRYPCNKDLETYFLDGKDIDVKNFGDCFLELITFLDGSDGLLVQIKEFEAEMAQNYR